MTDTTQLPPHTITINDHPEPHIMQWSDLELAAIKKYAESYALQAIAQATQAEVTDGIRPEDFTVDVVVKSMGGFAQINTKGARVTHKPTGISVTCDVARSQHTNRHQAFEKLRAILALRPAAVPSLIEKAISSGCFDVLPVKATIPMCKAGWGAAGGELTFQQIGRVYEEMYKARPLPDATTLAAQAKKETP